jgi:hypothetical protein
VSLRGFKLSSAAQGKLGSKVLLAIVEELLSTEVKGDLRIREIERGEDGSIIIEIVNASAGATVNM